MTEETNLEQGSRSTSTLLPATQQLLAASRSELGRVIAGQSEVIGEVLMAVLTQGHALLEGVPGIAKTLIVKSVGRLLGLGFQRVQGTPDLMPADILGTTMFRPGTDTFTFHAGPVFTDLLLVDEINRMPPRTQAALLECMEERQVTSDGIQRPLPPWFTVFATENPIDFEGTYPSLSAQNQSGLPGSGRRTEYARASSWRHPGKPARRCKDSAALRATSCRRAR
jgi:MoxR-like ATPase